MLEVLSTNDSRTLRLAGTRHRKFTTEVDESSPRRMRGFAGKRGNDTELAS